MISLHLTSSEKHALPQNIPHFLVTDADHLMAPLSLEKLSHFFFTLNDIPFDVHRVKKDDSDTIYVMAVLGYLPFTAESAERRQTLLNIVSATRELSLARFLVDKENKIVIAASFAGDTLAAPDFMFYPLMLFMQETRPFISLIGQYL